MGLNSFCCPVGFHPQDALNLKNSNISLGVGEMRTAGEHMGVKAIRGQICKEIAYFGQGQYSKPETQPLPSEHHIHSG